MRGAARVFKHSRPGWLQRWMALLALTVLLASVWPSAAYAGVIMPSGWDSNIFPANDDGSMTVTLPFSIQVGGANYNSGTLWNNGSLVIGGESLYLFAADIDTRVGNVVTYGSATWNGRPVFCVNFYGVRRYSAYSNTALNYMQMVIVDRSDIAAGAWDLWYNYDNIEWDPATVGFSGPAGNYVLPGSGTSGAFVDGGPYALAWDSLNTEIVGSYLFWCRSGMLVANPNVAPTVSTSPVTLEGNVSGGYSGSIPGASASDSDGTVVSFVNNAASPLTVGTHTITWTATDDDGATGTGTQSVTVRDTTAPSTPGISTCSHSTSAWSNDNTVDVTINASVDVCTGVDGYSYSFTSGSAGTPDTVKDQEESQLSMSSSALSDGTWYFNVRARDNAGNWGSTRSFGPILIDTTNPAAPSIASSSHTPSVDNNDPTVSVTWNAAADTGAGIDGYSYTWSLGGTAVPDIVKDLEESTLSVTSPTMVDGATWYFNIRARDNAGNWGSTTSYGPFVIDTTPPSGTMILDAGATYTASSSVSVESMVTGATQMQIDGGSWVDYAASASATIGAPDGAKTVTVIYRDAAGNTLTRTDAIVYDTTAPTGLDLSSSSHTEGGYSNDTTIEVDLETAATDALSGLAGYSWAWNEGSAATPDTTIDGDQDTATVSSSSLSDGSWYLSMRSVDALGNWSSAVTVGPFHIDTVPPSGTMVVDAAAAYTNSTSVSVDSDIVGAATMRVTVDGVVGGWITYADSSGATLSSGDGGKSVTVRYQDLAGNYYDVTDTIVLDQTAPSTDSDVDSEYTAGAVIELYPYDSLSGVAETYYRLDFGPKTAGAEVRVTTTGAHSIAYWSVDNAGNTENARTEWFNIISDGIQIAGLTRYDTAFAASQEAFEDGSAEKAVICAGDRWADAISAASLAGAVDGPLLLTPTYALPAGMAEELERLGVVDVTVVGGTASVSGDVVSDLEGLLGEGHVERIGGRDRYETASLVASATVATLTDGGGSYDGMVFIATGANFPDAVAAAPIAAAKGWPILLTRPDALSEVTSETVSDIGADAAVILGSYGAIGEQVEVDLAGILGEGQVSRLAGATRYQTAIAIAEFGVDNGLTYDGLAIGTGQSFADALAGGVMEARFGSVMLLTPRDFLDPSVAALLSENKRGITAYRILGGDGAVSVETRAEIEAALAW